MAIDRSKIQLGIPQMPEGVPPELFQQFLLVYNALHNLSKQVSLYTGVDQQDQAFWSQVSIDDTIFGASPARLYAKQDEAMLFGHCASLVLSGSELRVRFANATNNTRPAIGFVTSSTHVSAIGEFCEVTCGLGLITGVSGMVVPSRYFLSTTNGVITNVAPVAAGNIEQVVGRALAGNRLMMNIDSDWTPH